MLYNIEKKKEQTYADCLVCKYFDKKTKKCSGCNKCCFQYDPITKVIIDGVTKMPVKL